VLEKYRSYEEGFLKEANKAILNDDGQPDVMQSMHRDFLRMLQGALTIKDGELVQQQPEHGQDEGRGSREGTDDGARIKAQTSSGKEVFISLKDYVVRHLEAEADDASKDGPGGHKGDT